MKSFSRVWEPFVWYDQLDSLFISYYYHDPATNKIWVRAPFNNDFVVQEAYSDNDVISKQIKTTNGQGLFKIPFLKRVNRAQFKKVILIALLWLEFNDDYVYGRQIQKRGHEFYRCRDANKQYILLPLYASSNYTPKKNPVLIYHSGSIKNSLLLNLKDVYQNLVDIFEDYVLATPIIMNNERRFIVQFNEYPATFVFKDVNNVWW